MVQAAPRWLLRALVSQRHTQRLLNSMDWLLEVSCDGCVEALPSSVRAATQAVMTLQLLCVRAEQQETTPQCTALAAPHALRRRLCPTMMDPHRACSDCRRVTPMSRLGRQRATVQGPQTIPVSQMCLPTIPWC